MNLLYGELNLWLTLWGLTENKGPHSLVLHLNSVTPTAESKALGERSQLQ